MRKTLISLAMVAGLVTACSGSAGTDSPPTPEPSGAPTQVSQAATGNPTQAAPKTLDACSLITAGEASAVLSETVDPGAPPQPGARSCIFVESKTAADSVEISITGLAAFKPTQKSIPGLTITSVSGVGDEAYYLNSDPGYVVLNVRKGQITFTTSVILKSASIADRMAGEKTLAMDALARI